MLRDCIAINLFSWLLQAKLFSDMKDLSYTSVFETKPAYPSGNIISVLLL